MMTGVLDAGAAPFLQHGDAVRLRQAHVEDDRVVGFTLAEIGALFAVEGLVGDVAGLLERADHLPVDVPVILDDEQTHCDSLPR